RKLGVLAFIRPKELQEGIYRLSVSLDGNEDRQRWSDIPCILVCVLSGSLIIAKQVLSSGDFGTECNLVFEVTQDIAETRDIEIQIRVLTPLDVVIQKLAIEGGSFDEQNTAAIHKNAIVKPGMSLEFGLSGCAPFYQCKGWSHPQD